MGAGFHGGFGTTHGVYHQSSIDNNANSMKTIYPLTKSGYFGEKGKNCRIVLTDSPQVTSVDFYNRLSNGGKKIPLKNGKGMMTVLGDGVRRHIVGGTYRTLISVQNPLRLCRTGICRSLSAG